MKRKVSLKTFIPAMLLILVFIALAIVTGYALSLRSRTAAQVTAISSTAMPVETDRPLRTAQPAMPSPAPTVEPLIAVEADDGNNPGDTEEPFWSDGVLFLNDTYRSPDVSVTLTVKEDSELFNKKLIYYVADVHVSDVTLLRAGCSSGSFKRAGHGEFGSIAKRENALVAISGDYCPALIVRNGELFQRKISENDICLLLKNGEMVTMSSNEASINKIMEMDPWQGWQFGPALFDKKGNPIKSFPDIGITVTNPRSCIGYIEPGHYCLVVVDGRQKASRGATLPELAKLMQSLGCKQAYNLDGGASAHFYWKDTTLNHPSGGGRVVADIVYVAYEPYPASRFYCGKAGLSK